MLMKAHSWTLYSNARPKRTNKTQKSLRATVVCREASSCNRPIYVDFLQFHYQEVLGFLQQASLGLLAPIQNLFSSPGQCSLVLLPTTLPGALPHAAICMKCVRCSTIPFPSCLADSSCADGGPTCCIGMPHRVPPCLWLGCGSGTVLSLGTAPGADGPTSCICMPHRGSLLSCCPWSGAGADGAGCWWWWSCLCSCVPHNHMLATAFRGPPCCCWPGDCRMST